MEDSFVLLIRIEDHFAYGEKCNAVPCLMKYPAGASQVCELYELIGESHIDSVSFTNDMMIMFNGSYDNGEAPYNWLATGVRAVFQAKDNLACPSGQMPIMGNAAIVGVRKNGDIRGLTIEQAHRLADMLLPR